jgi:cell wall-associated NlpC family hydrolase
MTPEQRTAVIAEAESWLRTPYHDHGCVKGAGADCALFPRNVYERVLGMQFPVVPPYVQQFNLHRAEEVYLESVRATGAIEIVEADVQPGDFVLFRIGRCYSHGAIITAWPKVIHAINPRGVIRDDILRDPCLSRFGVTKPIFFTY